MLRRQYSVKVVGGNVRDSLTYDSQIIFGWAALTIRMILTLQNAIVLYIRYFCIAG